MREQWQEIGRQTRGNWLDTNIIIHYVTGDEPKKADAAAALFERVTRNELTVIVPDTVIAECVYVLSSPWKKFRKSRQEICTDLSRLLQLKGIQVANRRKLLRALDLYATHGIDFVDAFLKAVVGGKDGNVLYSYDTDFDHFPKIPRCEP